MIQRWMIQMVIGFAMRQLAKWQSRIDWAKVKADLAERVAALVPGEWLDAEAVSVCNAVIDAVAAALSSTEDLEKLVKLVVEQKFEEAWKVLRDLILSVWSPSSAAEKKVFECVKDCENLAA